MTPADEATLIALWAQGLETAAIAHQLGLKATTAQSRARRLQQRGLVQSRPRGGAYPSERARERAPDDRPPSAVHPDTRELKPLKHSVRWTVYVPQAMKEALQTLAAQRVAEAAAMAKEDEEETRPAGP